MKGRRAGMQSCRMKDTWETPGLVLPNFKVLILKSGWTSYESGPWGRKESMTKAAEDCSRTHKQEAKFGLARQTNNWHFPTSEDLIFHLKKRRVSFKCSLLIYFLKKAYSVYMQPPLHHQSALTAYDSYAEASRWRNQNNLSYQLHFTASGKNWWKRGWRGQRREPLPAPFPQRAAPASLWPPLLCWLQGSYRQAGLGWCWQAAANSLSSGRERWETSLEKQFCETKEMYFFLH